MNKLIDQYTKLSIDITRQLSKDEKKNYGIFITPKIIITKLIKSKKKSVVEICF